MTLTELKYVLAVAQEHHFGRAAESCSVSQPSLSVAVRKLEEELGVKIFERKSSDVTVTPIGKLIVERAQRVLEDAALLRVCAQQGKDPLSGELRLGTICTIAPYLIPDLVSSMHKVAANMPLILTEGLTANLLEQLKSGQLDAAIVSLPIDQPGIMIQPLYDEEFVAPKRPQRKKKRRRQLAADNLLHGRAGPGRHDSPVKRGALLRSQPPDPHRAF